MKMKRKIFILEWFQKDRKKNKYSGLVDEEQAACIASVNGNIQVIARAGSGKTTTLVNRTIFLLKHCNVDPNKMMWLALCNQNSCF